MEIQQNRTDGMGRGQELEEIMRGHRRKAVCVVRARQERTGILYTDQRLIKKPEDILAAFGRLLDRAGVEHLLAVSLTQRGEPVAVQLMSVGGVDSCMVSVAEIIKLALLSNCPSVLLIHNHPSGSVEPSKEDRDITERVEKAASIMGIHLTDHIIVGDLRNGYSIRGERKIHLPESDGSGAGGDNGESNKEDNRGNSRWQESCGKQKGA